ncbi:hypothetical protein ZHAS_00021991 [Anopheles sinensis]|uniref:Uncharacterized protein n=1 Tax=Anopheles sinensis TaxID=74873 RepID=A0A084WTD8_ANOSI|nr:hypothetical protein ZHAS_00021991 [Anopheles sinensis]
MCINGSFGRDGRCVCNPGYSEYRGNCFQQSVSVPVSTPDCPEGTYLWNGYCHYKVLPPIQDVVPPQEKLEVVPPLRIDIPIPELVDPLDPNYVTEQPENDDNEPEVIVPPGQGQSLKLNFEKIVSNNNVVNNETIVHTHNINNVVVHFSRRTPNGGFRTVVIRNNETTVHEDPGHDREKVTGEGLGPKNTTAGDCDEIFPTSTEPPRKLPCCTIVSPRVCHKQDDEWVCLHRKQYVCSTVCTADVMYLRPRRPTYRKPFLVMPPRPNPFARFKQCRFGRCPRLDCSGCINGRTQACHPMCYTYDCMVDNSCRFIDKELNCPDPSNELCVLLEEKTINLLKPTGEDANE